MSTFRLVVGITIMTALVYLGFHWAQNGSIPFLGFGENAQAGTGNPPRIADVALSALAMLIGLLFGALYQQLSSKNEPIQIGGELKAVITGAAFFRSLLVAPLVFGGVYAISSTQPDLVVALIFAFQNGFFCEAIFRQRHAKR